MLEKPTKQTWIAVCFLCVLCLSAGFIWDQQWKEMIQCGGDDADRAHGKGMQKREFQGQRNKLDAR